MKTTYLGKFVGELLDGASLFSNDIFVEPHGTVDRVAHNGIGLFVNLGQSWGEI